MKRLLMMTMAVSLAASCGGTGGEGGGSRDHVGHTESRTAWTERTEIFAEFHPPVAGEPADILVHVTDLEDFSPPRAGSMTLILEGTGGVKSRATAPGPASPGIWEIGFTVDAPGVYEASIVPGEGIGQSPVYIGTITAFPTEAAVEAAADHDHEGSSEAAGHDHAGSSEEAAEHDHEGSSEAAGHDHAGSSEEAGEHDHEGSSEAAGHDHADTEESAVHGHEAGNEPVEAGTEVVFLKEQQWSTDFMVRPVTTAVMRSGVEAIATVMPHRQGHAEIVSPVEGLLNVVHNREMVTEGSRVDKGGYLLTICPPPGGEGSWTERQQSFLRARREYERAQRLLESDAIARRDYEEIEKEYIVEKTGFEMILSGCCAEPVEDEETGEVHLRIQAPISGVVASIDVHPGQRVGSGQTLLELIDPAKVWLRAELFERDYYRLGEPAGVEISVPGMSGTFTASGDRFGVISGGEVFDPESRTIPMIFEVDNTEGTLKVGQVVQAGILTGRSEEMLAVPSSAVIDEDYTKYVFVQTGGETFTKREVGTGPESGGMTAVISGLSAGERVVTRGAYMLRLAASTGGAADPHMH